MRISICVATCERPGLLEELLAAFAIHDFGDVAREDGEFVFVDNDTAGSGLAVVEQWRNRLPFPVATRQVPERNIALARNAGVAAASGEFLLILDDDELPEPGWARELLAAARRYEADAVFGPVLPRYAEGVPRWVRDGGFFAPRAFRSGEIVPPHRTYTSNVLLRRSALEGIDGPFDPEFGRTGGSDVMLSWDMERRGARLVWCEEARVSESVPEARATRKWLLERSYSGGQNFARMETFHLHGLARAWRGLQIAAGALVRLPVALAAAVAFAVLTVAREGARWRTVHWLRVAVSQQGKITGVLGRQFQHYRGRGAGGVGADDQRVRGDLPSP